MNPERWEQVTDIYTAALELKAGERLAFLEEICAGDDELRREVDSLLAASDEAGDFIAEPVFKDLVPHLEKESSLIGKKLSQYQIISQIGKGGMGEVYLAKDSRLNRLVALKTLPVSLAGNETYLNRFQTEARAAATLNHPNVGTIYSVEEFEEQRYITMEYVAGKTLDALIPQSGLDLKTFLEWMVPISDALSHAHDKGIVHRDIKPGNIMITEDGVPKILDFGLAQIDRTGFSDNISTLKMTQPGQVMGTPSYMSPEQAEGAEVDPRTDIFSLGIVMYEAITGKRPFVGDNYASVVSNLLRTEPQNIAEIKPETPYLLTRLIHRCLGKTPRHRPQTMREVRVILEEIQAAVEAGIISGGSSKRLLAGAKGFSFRWIVGIAILLVASIAGLALYQLMKDNSPAPISFTNLTLRKLSLTNNVAFVQISPDGKSIVYITLDEDSTRSLWIRRIEDKNTLQLVSKEFRQFWGGLAISPDGSQVFYSLSDENARHGTLYRIPSLGGTPRKLVEKANDVGSLTSDGQRIVFVRRDENQLQILSANTSDGGDERLIHTGKADELFRDPRFSADDKSIFFSKRESISGKTFWSLVEIPAHGGPEKKIFDSNGERIGELAVLKDGKGVIINRGDDVSNLQQLYYVSLADGKLERLTNDLNSYQGVGISDDGNSIVAAQRSSFADIWTVKPGESPRKLTNESNIYSTAMFAPDGRIVYDAFDNNRPSIWMMNADGSNPQQLTTNESFNLEPQVSPDGRFIVFTSDRSGENKIWRMNLDGSNPTLLTNVEGPTFSPRISPDSQTVWFQWNNENKQILAKVPLNGGEVTEQAPFGNNLWAISPDGKQVALVFFDAPSNQFKIRVRPLDAEEPSKVFDIAVTNILKWTADGKNLIYRTLEPSPEMLSMLWIKPIAGGEPKLFLSVKPDRVLYLSPSADGKQTLFVRSKVLSDAVMLTKIK